MEKEIPLGDRVFIVKKFTPQKACYWAFQLLGNIEFFGDKAFIEKIQKFIVMDEKKFEQFQRDCLSFVFVKMDSGNHCLVNSDGFLTVLDLLNVDLFQLTTHSFMYSMSDFFDQALIQGLIRTVVDSFPQVGSETSPSSP